MRRRAILIIAMPFGIALNLALALPAEAAGSCRCTGQIQGGVAQRFEICFDNPGPATADECKRQVWYENRMSVDGNVNPATVQCQSYLSGQCGEGAAGEPVDKTFKFRQVNAALQIPIPNFKLSELKAESIDGSTDVVRIPWIGQYLAAIYRWAVPVGAILAVVIIMIGGVIWLTSGGASRLSTAKQWIGNAVIGLFLLVGSYVVLNLINPDLVNFTQLAVRIVKPEKIVMGDEPDEISGFAPGNIVTITGKNIVGNSQIDESILPAVQRAAEALPADIQLSVTSSFRSVEKQKKIILQNCQNPPGAPTCNPKPGRPTTCMLKNGPASCPHTTGRAVDAWGAKNGRQCVRRDACLQNKDACRSDYCQKAVIDAMRAQGFCNLQSEPWHFEMPKMSPGCT